MNLKSKYHYFVTNQGFFKFFLLAFLNTLTVLVFSAPNIVIQGNVKDNSTNEPLLGVNIYNLSKTIGTSTDIEGNFSLILEKADTLYFSYIGYTTQAIYIDQSNTFDIQLSIEELATVIISAESNYSQPQFGGLNTIKLDKKTIEQLPKVLGEYEVLKSLQTLPGVQSGGEGERGIFVRGGGADQTQMVIDGMPVYNVSHLYGFLSVFNSDVVDNATIFKNYIPVKYGGRLAAAVQIETDSDNKEQWNTTLRLGTFNSAVATSGPLIKSKLDMFFALRGTYAGTYIRPLSRAQFASKDGLEGGEIGYYFYDINAGINYIVNEKNTISLRYFYSEDRYQILDYYAVKNPITSQIDYTSDTDKRVKWRNSIASLNWKFNVNENWKITNTLGSSFYSLNNIKDIREMNRNSLNEMIGKYKLTTEKSTINDILWHINVQRKYRGNLFLNFGNTSIFRPILILEREKSATNKAMTLDGYPTQNTYELSQYIEVEKLFENKIRINSGVKTSINLLENKVYCIVEPRGYISVPFKNGNVYFGEQVTSQSIHLLVSSTADLLNDLWIPSTKYFKPEIAIQSDLGFNHKISLLDYGTSVYFRNLFHLIEYKSSSPYLIEDIALEKQITGDVKGKAYGVEAYAKLSYKIFNFWIKYNFGKSIRQSPNVNLGRSYPYKYERKHDINITTTLKLGKKWSANLAWVYGSGNNVSLPNSQYASSYTTFVIENVFNSTPIIFENQNQINQYSGKNNFRLPAYHHLDIGFTCKKERPRIKQEFNISIINIYNRLNVFSTYIVYKSNSASLPSIQYNKLTLMPILPSFSYAIKF